MIKQKKYYKLRAYFLEKSFLCIWEIQWNQNFILGGSAGVRSSHHTLWQPCVVPTPHTNV